VKTTIDIPEPLYRQAKIRAGQTGQTLKQFVLLSLSRELQGGRISDSTPGKSFWERRTLLPAYEAALKEGAFSRGQDSAAIISEDRSSLCHAHALRHM
jgi:hypothetical protein